MSAYLFYSPQFRPLSISGDILPGAKLQFYESGTTTPADVYSDADLTTPLANPVVADSSGEFPPIYLDPAVTYRAILSDEDDVQLWDIDPLAPARDYPPGTILMFYGSEQELEAAYPPSLWQRLDGNNGAPDMRDRFPVCVSSTLSPGDTGGSASGTTSAAGGHDHGGATSETVLTADNMPVHHHRLFVTNNNISSQGDGWMKAGTRGIPGEDVGPFAYREDSETGDQLVEDTGEADPDGHDHDITEESDHTHTVSTVPPYLALWFIMRRST